MWERTPHNPLCRLDHTGQVLPVLCSAAPVPHCCTEDALCCGSAEVCQKLRGESSPFQLPQEEEPSLGLLHQVGYVHGPSEVRCDVDAQELDVVHPLHLPPMNAERGVFSLDPGVGHPITGRLAV